MESSESKSTHSSIVEKLPESVSSGSVMSCYFETSLLQKSPRCCKNEVLSDNPETDLRNSKTIAEFPIVQNINQAIVHSACSSSSSCEEEISLGEQQNKIEFQSYYEQTLTLPDEEVIAKLEIDQGTVPDPEVDDPEPQKSQSQPFELLGSTTKKQQMSDQALKGSTSTAPSNSPKELKNDEKEIQDSESELLPLIRPSRKGMRLNEESEFDAVATTVRESLVISPPPFYPDIRVSL